MANRRISSTALWAACLSASFAQGGETIAASAKPNPQQENGELRTEVQQLKSQQQLILDRLDEIKTLLKGNNGPPPVEPPLTMSMAGASFRGEAAAPVAIIEYGDFECPFCRRFQHTTYLQIHEAYIKTGKLRYYYRDMPLPFHPQALPAARAAHCAGEQGKFWQMHDSLFADEGPLEAGGIDARAGKLGLDVSKLDACVASDRFANVIQKGVDEATQMQITGTPTFLVGTVDAKGNVVNIKKAIVGAQPFEAFKATVDPLLAAR
jgi:protein-disulfide isomerase